MQSCTNAGLRFRSTAARFRRPTILYALGGACVTALLVALAAGAYAESGPGAPLSPPRGLLWSAGLLAAAVSYVLAVVIVRGSGARTAVVAAIAVSIQLATLSGPLLFSSDVYTYWTYGRMAGLHQANPYSDSPSDYSNDPPYRYVGEGLASTTSIYGPGFSVISDLHARHVGESPRTAELAYRSLMALAIVALVLILCRWGSRPAFSAVFLGWNPLVALHAGGGGHNDAVMLLLAVSAVLLGTRRHGVSAGVSWAASLSIKSAVLPLLPLEIVATARSEDGLRRVVRLLGGLLVGSLVLTAIATALYGTAWMGVFSRAQGQARQTSSISSTFLLQEHGLSQSSAKTLMGACLLVGFLWLLRSAFLHGQARLGLASALIATTQSWLVPWYGLWAVGFAADEDDTVAHVAAVALSLYLLRDALPRPLL